MEPHPSHLDAHGDHHELGWLRDLNPDPAATPDPVSDTPTRAAVETLIGTGPLLWGVLAAREATEFILESLPQFGGDSVAELLLARAVESTTLTTLASFVDPERSALWPAPEPATAVESYVSRGISLDTVIRGIHMLQEVMARQLLGAIWSPSRASQEAQWSSDHLFRTFDMFTADVAAYYMTKAQEWSASESQARDALIEKILDPRSDADMAAAFKVLRYDLDGDHLACELWLGDGVDDAQAEADIQIVLQRLIRAPGIESVIHRRVDHTTAHIWCRLLNGALPDLTAAIRGTHARLASGTRGAGRDGFRRSYQEALLAGRTMRWAASENGRVGSFSELEVTALMSTDLGMARRFVQRHLAALADDSPRAGELRETLSVYLENDRSVTRAAAIVHAHRNTVVYRIKQAEESLGPLEGRSLEIRAALRLAQQLGTPVLRQV